MPGGEDLTAAQVERNRAMEAASELTGKKNGRSGYEKGMDINLPGGRTLGAGGAKEKPVGITARVLPTVLIVDSC